MRLQVYDVDVKERDNRKLRLPEQDFLGGWVGERVGERVDGWVGLMVCRLESSCQPPL